MNVSAADAALVTGALRWNIKQSFRDYVAELPDGEESREGLDASAGADLVFPARETVAAGQGPARVYKFSGAVSFAGHGGMLAVRLSDPWLEVDEQGRSVLSANVGAAGGAERRAPIASVDGAPALNDSAWTFAPDVTSLSVLGAAVLGSVYPPGADADGFDLRVVPQ
jgi:hypothetical protein